MTHLVTQLGGLGSQFPHATNENPVRVRLLGQTLRFHQETNTLTLKSFTDNSFVDVALNAQQQYPGEIMIKGAMVDVYGLFSGEEVHALDVDLLRDMALDPETLASLQQFMDHTKG